MAENSDSTGNGQAQNPPQIVLRVLGQYIRDLSFENIVAMKGISGEVTPDINIQISLDGKKRDPEHQYEVNIKFKITSTNKNTQETMFLMELDYGGIFHIENVPEEQLHPFLMIECPRMIFPFARRIIHDIIRDGGFPPLNLDTIDWVDLYRKNMAQQAQAAAGAQQPQGQA